MRIEEKERKGKKKTVWVNKEKKKKQMQNSVKQGTTKNRIDIQ